MRRATREAMEEAARESVEVLGVEPALAVDEAKRQMEVMGLHVDDGVVRAVRKALGLDGGDGDVNGNAEGADDAQARQQKR